MKDLAELGLREAAARIHSGSMTSEAYTRACLARITARESEVAAWAWLDVDAALAHARHADQHLLTGLPTGPLHGIPLGIKDIMHTRGIPTEMGSPAYAGFVPEDSAAVVKCIEAAGAFVLGKTVTAELAYYTPGKTHNPWNPAHTPGGSSSGSAAAVAAGMVPGALGTQTNGSVIRPAAFCGVVGFKPSAGLVPRTGILSFSATLDQVGVFTRTVTDAVMLTAAVLGRDPRDPASIESGQIATGLAEVAQPETAPRLLAVRQPVWDQAEAAQQQAFSANLAALRHAGACIEGRELPADFAAAHGVHRTIMHYEAARALQALQARQRGRLSAPINELIDAGLEIEAAAYMAALAQRRRLQELLANELAEVDAIVTLPAPGEAPPTLMHTGSPAFCTIWSLAGVPALSIPSGLGPCGLPLGLQLVGRHLDDPALLATAAWCERVLGSPGAGGRGA